ncbi:endonuclease III [Cryptococcus wingfieldii CBS 7118]|uniref:Endonuclease III homolog n=1 Tax=Cryptococcus wingfieldii CBS 7118 TaxID=1295528 RepID=A0A1E3J358_9TREE|nr:endonuclease III [Cryptococcus wingfieldii CBS 7118]ODN95282.1 endonuclease III [Cryptococcus wingfieldii CBS 7118]
MSRSHGLKATQSALNSSVKIISAERTNDGQVFTSLRRTTRSAKTAAVDDEEELPKKSKLNVPKYEYKPATPSPRKKPRLEDAKAEPDVKIQASPIKRVATPRSTPKKPMPQTSLAKPHQAPAKWEDQYRLIEHMRRGIIAPVDDMGCERPRTGANDAKTFRFHILISLMLSAQTKDAVTSAAVSLLHETLPGGLTAESLAAAPAEQVHDCINKVGFWRRKADYIQEAAKHLLEKEGEEKGDVPNTLEGLCELKGVGPKMAFLALQCAWDINAGIGVDVHVHRITNRLKWHKPPTTNPEQTRLNLQSWLPEKLHKPINPLMVGFGQMICLPVGPRCDLCLLGQRGICPSRVRGVTGKGRKDVVFTFGEVEEEGKEVGEWAWGQTSDSFPDALRPKKEPKVEISYESLQQIADLEPQPQPITPVKMERGVGLEEAIEEPGLRSPEQVLEVIDQVDGVTDIGAEVKKETVDW